VGRARAHRTGGAAGGVRSSSHMRSRSIAVHWCISRVTPAAACTPPLSGRAAPPPK